MQVEAEFLAGAESNLLKARGRQLRGSLWRLARLDEGASIRAALAARRLFDRELLGRLPQNGRVVLYGHERRWWFRNRRTCVAIASVLAPPEHYLPGEEATAPPPIGLSDLVEHVRRIVGDASVPHIVAVCSPSGFTDEVKRSHVDLPNVTLIVVEPRAGGGWSVVGLSEAADQCLCALFDPDTTAKKVRRVREEIETRTADLLTGGVSAREIAERLELPTEIVVQAFRQAAMADPELRVTGSGRDVLLFRGAPVASMEDGDMSVVDRIRQLFGLSGNEAKKINVLSERRAMLAQRRDRLYEDIARLEQRERDLLEQGRQNKSPVARRRIASQLAQHRREMNRLNTTAAMLNQQINVISTHIHNLTLIQQGQMARLPTAEDLANDAVRAEEMLEQLKADVDLVGTLESGVGEALASQDELEILREFDEPETPAKAQPTAATAESDEPEAAPPTPEKKRDKPEAV